MILSSDDIRRYIQDYALIEPVSEARLSFIEGCAFDLQLAKVEQPRLTVNSATIAEAYRRLPEFVEYKQGDNGLWGLAPGRAYKLTSLETVNMPYDLRGEIIARRSLPEAGLLCQCTGVAPGYCGTLSIIVYNAYPFTAFLGPRSRFAAVQFFKITEGATDPYKGPRQGNRPLGVVAPPH